MRSRAVRRRRSRALPRVPPRPRRAGGLGEGGPCRERAHGRRALRPSLGALEGQGFRESAGRVFGRGLGLGPPPAPGVLLGGQAAAALLLGRSGLGGRGHGAPGRAGVERTPAPLERRAPGCLLGRRPERCVRDLLAGRQLSAFGRDAERDGHRAPRPPLARPDRAGRRRSAHGFAGGLGRRDLGGAATGGRRRGQGGRDAGDHAERRPRLDGCRPGDARSSGGEAGRGAAPVGHATPGARVGRGRVPGRTDGRVAPGPRAGEDATPAGRTICACR